MQSRIQPKGLEDFFLTPADREGQGVYFTRLCGWNQSVHDFVLRYFGEARRSGCVIEGPLQNPDSQQLGYYQEIMGSDFRLEPSFVNAGLQKWLPRMRPPQRSRVADGICRTLLELRQKGKNDNMLKNAYIKFMCWLYYKYERIASQLGGAQPPKLLYIGAIGSYALLLLNVLSLAGCDIVLLETDGGASYRAADPEAAYAIPLSLPDLAAFPPNLSLRQLQTEIQEAMETERLLGGKPVQEPAVNTWITGSFPDDLRKPLIGRGDDNRFFYNAFFRISGVEDTLTYENELYQLQLEIGNSKRPLLILSGAIPPPTNDEIAAIQRKPCQTVSQLAAALASNLRCADPALQTILRKAFVELLLLTGAAESNLNRLTNKAVYLLCWLKRYQGQLFGGWKLGAVGCLLRMGGCRNDTEALFFRLLARTPTDVAIFVPNLNESCCLSDSLLYEVHNPLSLNVTRYPEVTSMRAGTTAYHAERELDTLMYQDSGLYRSQQYGRANAVTLQTMYEEIPLLWDQEVKFRPHFSTVDDIVNIPVLFSKISGVKDGDVNKYWSGIRSLLTEDTVLITSVPHISSAAPNPMKAYTTEFLKNGRLNKAKLKSHKAYPYGFLRESVQEHLMDKLQLLISEKRIKGTFENGMEYTIAATVLNLDKQLLRLIQKFDFTKKNPKLVYIITGETALSPEDAICAAFLNLVGFDVLFYVPTGYQCVEAHYNGALAEEHQIGEYVYDLTVPDLRAVQTTPHRSWCERLFGRG